jgi:hypothetical protein
MYRTRLQRGKDAAAEDTRRWTLIVVPGVGRIWRVVEEPPKAGEQMKRRGSS